MSQTDKERALDQIWKSSFNEEGDELGMIDLEAAYDAGAKAGYSAALEDAAKTAESFPAAKDDKELWTPIVERVAAAIRKLESKG